MKIFLDSGVPEIRKKFGFTDTNPEYNMRFAKDYSYPNDIKKHSGNLFPVMWQAFPDFRCTLTRDRFRKYLLKDCDEKKLKILKADEEGISEKLIESIANRLIEALARKELSPETKYRKL